MRKILGITCLCFILLAISLATVFKHKHILLRITDENSLYYLRTHGAGEIVLKNPFRDRTLEKKIKLIITKVIEYSETNNKGILDSYVETQQESGEETFNISLNRAAENPRFYVKEYTVKDIIKENERIIFILEFIPYGEGCLILDKKTGKISSFSVIF